MIETLGQARCVDRLARPAFDTGPLGCTGPEQRGRAGARGEGTKWPPSKAKARGPAGCRR
jgi:hypothetical protein